MSNLYQIQTAKPAGWSLLKEMADPNLQAIALFCAIGLVISVYVMTRYPEFGSIMAQYSQF